MRSIGAAIIISSACAVLIGAAFVNHSDTSMALTFLGFVVGAIGLHGWFTASCHDTPKE
jgi:hypothetical protein